MRFTERFAEEKIAEWAVCYLNYEHLKVLSMNVRDSVREKQQLTSLKNFKTHVEARTQKTISLALIELEPSKIEEIERFHTYFTDNMKQSNQMFCQFFHRNMELYGQFVKWKRQQIQTNFSVCWKVHFMMEEEDKHMKNTIISYIQYLFAESLYLSWMVQTNIQAQMRILAKYELYQNQEFPHLEPQISQKLNIQECHRLRRQIQRFYFRINKGKKEQCRHRLRKLAQDNGIKPKQTLVIGILVGAVLTIIVFMSVIISRSSVTLQTHTIFNADFGLWRGISFFIFYIWALGVDLSYYQKYKISFRIILKNNYPEHPASTDLYRVAGIFSIIFITAFTIYSLELVGVIEAGAFYAQWLPLFIWVPFLLFLINPLPILYPYGRLFFFKTLLNGLFSVFLFIDFPKVWVIAQSLSLLNVFQDLFYTACFYSTLNLPEDPTKINCKAPAIQAKFIYTVVIYLIRILQCIKVGFGQCRGQWRKVQFLNAFKFILALLTTILAHVYSQNKSNSIFVAWIVFAIISAIGLFSWDYSMGWDLFVQNKTNRFLRDQLLFPKKIYYISIVLNFILRFVWMMNISSEIFYSIFGSPEIFSLVVAYLQIFRRAMGSLMRVQVQQIANNEALQALSKQKQDLQDQIAQYLHAHSNSMNDFSTYNLVQTEKHMINVTQQQKKSCKKIKEDLIKKIKQFRKYTKQHSLKAEQIRTANQKNVAELLKNVY